MKCSDDFLFILLVVLIHVENLTYGIALSLGPIDNIFLVYD